MGMHVFVYVCMCMCVYQYVGESHRWCCNTYESVDTVQGNRQEG